ncbi:MAG TPA: bifunctional riboflavin kinase/FMN adenylyltransferase [Acidobacteriaceae bacterium]|nr:bifunctional riboflavin kinase/FMN adenylyltransferase [Acidobacteriaceae bacterium]
MTACAFPSSSNPPMQTFRNPAELPADFRSTVVSVGNYDGVHLGHRFLLARVVERAGALRALSVAVTFEPHPTHLLRPGAGPRLITPTLAERLDLLATTGIDATVVLPFTAEFSQQSAEAFARDVLLQRLRAVEVHEGDNFRFGFRARAGIEELSTLGGELGFAVHIYKPLQIRGMDVSSSLIRRLLSAGDLRRARWLLGRPFSILSTPAHGRGVGSRLTVPTINFAAYDGLVPEAGVYVTRMQVAAGLPDELCFDSVTNIGIRPTFADASFAVESHLLDFRPVDLGETTPLRLTFLARLRDERQWPSPEALREQIGRDVQVARRYLRRLKRP